MATFSSIRLISRNVYSANVTCRWDGPAAAESLTTADGSRGWVDVGADGTIDAVRDGDQLVVSAQLVPGWRVPTPWVSIPADPKNPLTRLAVASSQPLAHVVSTLLTSPTQGDVGAVLPQLESSFFGLSPPVAQGHDTVDGHKTTRYLLRSPKDTPGDVHAEAWVDSDNVMWRFKMTNTQDPYGSQASTLDVTALNQSVVIHLPNRTAVTPIAHAAAAPVLLASSFFTPSCNPPSERSKIAAKRTCLTQRASGQDVSAYLAANQPLVLESAYRC
jgi:hypothetical protein